MPLRDARTGLAAIARRLVDARRTGSLDLARRPAGPPPSCPPPRLLGAFDPLLLGWTSREKMLGEHATAGIVTDNGLFRPFALVRGRAVAIWMTRAAAMSSWRRSARSPDATPPRSSATPPTSSATSAWP